MTKEALNNTKGDVMNKPTNPNKPTKPVTGEKQRGIGVVELLFAATTLGAAVLVAAMESKRPSIGGD
jgi:hypothetical protein